jgi:hypothetical protein
VLVVSLLVDARAPVDVAVDDTLQEAGKEVWAASWFHGGSVPAKTGYGNN